VFVGFRRLVLLCALTCVLSAQQLRVVTSSEIQDQTFGLQFLDELNGLYFSAGWLNTTADAGRTWRQIQISKSYLGANVFGLHFRTARDGWHVVSKDLMRTSDGGQTWRRIRSPLEPPNVAWFCEDENLAWVGGSESVPAKEPFGPNWAFGKIGDQLTVLQARVYATSKLSRP
jgi:photosystem II stability/assembly factor-like uncharacterized protein